MLCRSMPASLTDRRQTDICRRFISKPWFDNYTDGNSWFGNSADLFPVVTENANVSRQRGQQVVASDITSNVFNSVSSSSCLLVVAPSFVVSSCFVDSDVVPGMRLDHDQPDHTRSGPSHPDPRVEAVSGVCFSERTLLQPSNVKRTTLVCSYLSSLLSSAAH